MSKSLRRNHHLPRRFQSLPQSPRCRLLRTPTSQDRADPGSKQSRVIAMLQSPDGGNDRRDDEGNRLAAALGARFPCRRGAQTPQAEAQLEEGGRQPGLPDRWRKQRQDGGSPVKRRRPERHAARQDRSCTAGPEQTLDVEIARLRDLDVSNASGSLAHASSGGGHPLTCPVIFCIAFWPTGCRPNASVTSIVESQRLLDRSGSPEKAGHRALDLSRSDHEPEAGHYAGPRMERSGCNGSPYWPTALPGTARPAFAMR